MSQSQNNPSHGSEENARSPSPTSTSTTKDVATSGDSSAHAERRDPIPNLDQVVKALSQEDVPPASPTSPPTAKDTTTSGDGSAPSTAPGNSHPVLNAGQAVKALSQDDVPPASSTSSPTAKDTTTSGNSSLPGAAPGHSHPVPNPDQAAETSPQAVPPASSSDGLPGPEAGAELKLSLQTTGLDTGPESSSTSSGSEDGSETSVSTNSNETSPTTPGDDAGDKSAGHVQLTLLPSLTDLGNGDPAATEWVRYLIQAVGRDVLSFRRNTQVSYMVLQRARDIVNTINEYIAKVDNDESEDGDWDSFFKYSKAIKPFEE
jgi:hypothetical protein